jgi:hypothetical protein
MSKKVRENVRKLTIREVTEADRGDSWKLMTGVYVIPDLDSRTGFRHREWQKCWRLIKPSRKCGAKL